jgi:hypothetical protein
LSQYVVLAKFADDRKKAIKEMSNIYHPINVTTGLLQTADDVKIKFAEQLTIIEVAAEQAGLGDSFEKNFQAGKRSFAAMKEYITYYFEYLSYFVGALELTKEQKNFFKVVIYPFTYLKMTQKKRRTKQERDEFNPLIEQLEIQKLEGPWTEELKKI